MEKHFLKYVIEKGYICVDGLSLTVAKKNKTSIEIALIPHTMKITNFHQKNVEDEVNIEVDMFAKYIENYMGIKK
jgi:riboflavin synthase